VASVMALFWAPTDAVQGDVYRILYVHVPLAWLAYLAFVLVFLASVAWLWTKRPFFDAVAVASAEIGVLFTGLFLVAGSIWAKPTWGVWWTWEPRLVTTAIMFVMYVGYLLLRGLSTDFSRRATRAAVFVIIAALGVAVLVGTVAATNLASSTVYYLTPSEAKARNIPSKQIVRLGGQVKADTLRVAFGSGGTATFSLVITDGVEDVLVIADG